MKNTKKASFSLYILILVFFAMVFSYIVLSNMEIMNNKSSSIIISEFEDNILSKNANLNLNYSLNLNSDGNGFKDDFSCPKVRITNDTGTLEEKTNLFIQNELGIKKIYCKGVLNGKEVIINFVYNSFSDEQKSTYPNLFSNSYSTKIFDFLRYDGQQVNLNSSYSGTLGDDTFSLFSYIGPDDIDDNLNSDNYSINSKNTVLYPDSLYDNDYFGRKYILGIVLENKKRVNIFANSKESNLFIDNNPNNISPIKKITELDNVSLELSLNREINYSLEIFEESKSTGNIQKRIINPQQNNKTNISGFNFRDNYYKIFLLSEENLYGLHYKINTFSEESYISPINDSKDNTIEIYQNYVVNHSGKDVIIGKKFSLKKCNKANGCLQDGEVDEDCTNPVKRKPNGITIYVPECAVAGQEYMFEGETYYVAKGGNAGATAVDIRNKIESGFPANRIITSKVTTMENLFKSIHWSLGTNFNQDISSWDTSNVTNFRQMFYGTNFNQDISFWDVSSGENFHGMFELNKNFNKPINTWEMSNAKTISFMFYKATSFNQPLNNWNTSNVESAQSVFRLAENFNQDISSWDVSNVIELNLIFYYSDLSIQNYDAVLNSWSNQNVRRGVRFTSGNKRYCNGEAGRNKLKTQKNWLISDGGKLCN